MRSKHFTAFLFFLLLPAIAFSRQVLISISDKGYKNEEFRFYTVTDPVTGQLKPLLKVVADSKGDLTVAIEFETGGGLVIKTGVYYLTFFPEPGKTYELQLPPFKRKSVTDELNPFYIEQRAVPYVLNDSLCINNRIREFETHFNSVYDSVSLRIFNNIKVNEIALFASELDKYPGADTASFYGIYVRSKKAVIDLMTFKSVSEKISGALFINNCFDIANPAYTNLVNQLFSDYFRNPGSDVLKAAITSAIGSGLFSNVKGVMANNKNISDTRLQEYIVVLNLYNEYFAGRFAPGQIVKLLSEASSGSGSEEIRDLAAIAVEKIKRLQPGSISPSFRLAGMEGDSISAADYAGRYILLNFARSDSYATMSEFSIMKMWEERYGNDLKIITILTDRDYKGAVTRLVEAGYSWEMLDGSDCENLLFLYEVKMLPSFILIDNDGRIILAPAMLPSERLESKISSLIQQDRIKSGLVK